MLFFKSAITLAVASLLTTVLAESTSYTSTFSRRPLSRATTISTTTSTTTPLSSSTSTLQTSAPGPTDPTLALGTVYSRGSYATNYIIWSPTFNRTADLCGGATSIAVTSAYTGPNHDYCNYPFDFGGYTGLKLVCKSDTTAQYQSGQVTGIALSNGTVPWTCTNTPLSNQYGAGGVAAYHCPSSTVLYDYQDQISLFYICQ